MNTHSACFSLSDVVSPISLCVTRYTMKHFSFSKRNLIIVIVHTSTEQSPAVDYIRSGDLIIADAWLSVIVHTLLLLAQFIVPVSKNNMQLLVQFFDLKVN